MVISGNGDSWKDDESRLTDLLDEEVVAHREVKKRPAQQSPKGKKTLKRWQMSEFKPTDTPAQPTRFKEKKVSKQKALQHDASKDLEDFE
jgi:hypothetical protein